MIAIAARCRAFADVLRSGCSRTRAAIVLGFAIIPTMIASSRSLGQSAEAFAAATAGLPVYELTVGQVEWDKLRRAPRSEERQPAKFTTGGMEYSVGVRYRGDWARTWPKKPLKIFFEKGKDLEGQRVLNLNSNWRDPAFIREQLAYWIYDACGVPAPKTRMVKLNVNGGFHGLYLEVEQPEKAFLKRVGLKGAAVYKANSHRLRSDESDLGEEALFRANYEKETRKDEDYSDLQSFCHELATTTDAAAFFGTRLDLDRYVNFLAGNILVQNWDWFTKNHFLAYDVAGSKKWVAVPWDLDRTLGDHWGWRFDVADVPLQLGTKAMPGIIGWNKLFDAFYRDPTLRKRLLDRLEVLLNTEFTEKKLFPILSRWESEISVDVALDRQHWPNPDAGDLHAGVQGVKEFIRARRAYLLGGIASQRKENSNPAEPPADRSGGVRSRQLPRLLRQ